MNEFNNKEIVEKNNELFDLAVEKFGVSNSAVKLDDQQSQYLRFYELIKYVDLNDSNKTILDIGCGNGELYKFLNFLGYRGTYIGYDVNEKLINQAQSRFSNIEFVLKDILSEPLEKQFDYVLMSGLFNANIGQSLAWTHEFTEKMYAYCKEFLAFNAISTFVSYKDDDIYCLSPEKMLKFCIEKLSPRTTITHHNLPYNYSVIVYRNHEWTSANKEKNKK